MFINGKQTEKAAQSLPLFDEGFINVFETMRVERGVIFRLNEHVERLFESAKTLGIPMATDREAVKKLLRRIVRKAGLGEKFFLRHMVMSNQAVTFAFSRPYPEAIYREGVRLRTAVVRRNLSNALPPEAKSSQFLNGVLAAIDASGNPVFETLFLSCEGYVNEARVWNFFLIQGGSLVTPPAPGILNGVTRRFVIECAGQKNLQVRETPVSRHDVWNAEEAFLTNTVGGIVPVSSLDGRSIGLAVPGPLTRRLRHCFE